MYAVLLPFLCLGSAEAVSQLPSNASLLQDLGDPVNSLGKSPVTTRVIIKSPAAEAPRKERTLKNLPPVPTTQQVSAFAPRPTTSAFAPPASNDVSAFLASPASPPVPPTTSFAPPPIPPQPMTPGQPQTSTQSFSAQVLGATAPAPATTPTAAVPEQPSNFVQFVTGAMATPNRTTAPSLNNRPLNGSNLHSLFKSLQ